MLGNGFIVFLGFCLSLAEIFSKRYENPCDTECVETKGCNGPGPGDCEECRHFKDERNLVCLESCDNETFFIEEENCYPCHQECEGGCNGWTSLPHECSGCKNMKSGIFCVPKCYKDEYAENMTCLKCHKKCPFRCAGPLETDCSPCPKPLIQGIEFVYQGHAVHMGTNKYYGCPEGKKCPMWVIEDCLSLKELCPKGYYEEHVPLDAKGKFALFAGNSACFNCHAFCRECTGYGVNPSVCQNCSFAQDCKCPDFFYPSNYGEDCSNRCKDNCKVCTEIGVCKECGGEYKYRVYETAFPTENDTFKCAMECPSHHPFSRFDDVLHDYCSLFNFTETKGFSEAGSGSKYMLLILSVAFLVLLFLTGCLFLGYIRTKKQVASKSILPDSETLLEERQEPIAFPNVAPNRNKLRIIRESDVTKTAVLGSGAFGIVYRGLLELEGSKAQVPVAIKVFNPQNKETSTKELLKEASIMGRVNHPNLLPLTAICVTSNVMLVTQLMPLGDLHHYIRKHYRDIMPRTMLNWCVQLAKGMDYLEKLSLLHRDLAARNVLIQSKSLVRITDFGLARTININEGMYESRGGKLPVKWLALESLRNGIFTHKTDVWSLGVTVWEILTFGKEPYSNVTLSELLNSLEIGERLQQPDSCSADLYSVLATCWAEEATARPSFQELVDTFYSMLQDPGQFIFVLEDDGKQTAPDPLPRNFYFDIDENSSEALVFHSYENIHREPMAEANPDTLPSARTTGQVSTLNYVEVSSEQQEE